MKLKQLKTLHMTDPLGIDVNPYFSWKMESMEQNVLQTAYQVVVCKRGKGEVWNTGKVITEASSYIVYEGEPLESCTEYVWTVTVWDNKGNEAVSSAKFETAFLRKTDWKAKWIDSPLPMGKRKQGYGNQLPAAMFRKAFALKKEVKKARLYVTCHGIYELSLNGAAVDERKFAPEFTSYGNTLCYQTYDVTAKLCKGSNALGMYVGDGWYCGVHTKPDMKNYKPIHAVLFQLEIEYADGEKETVISDENVKVSEGPVRFSDLFDGERYDANRIQKGWDTPDFDDSKWMPGMVAQYGYETLDAQLGEPVRTVMEVPCAKVIVTPNGDKVLDFEQVVCGGVRMKVNVPKGMTVKLEHSEVLDKNGNFKMNILAGTADQTLEYISDGTARVYEPHFSFQGFRYIRVTGIEDVKAEDFTAQIYSTQKENAGTFACSNAKVNRLYENTRWSQRANMLSIPTDCPQREKAGWTGDIQVYATAALLNEDISIFLTRWLKSLALEQKENGAVPMIVPMTGLYIPAFGLFGKLFGNEDGIAASAGWSDAAVLVPWQMYQVTGNTAILRQQYDSMKKWCDYVIRAAKTKHVRGTKLPREKEQYLWNTGYHWGEWLIPSMSKNGYGLETVKSVFQTRKYIAPAYAYYAIRSMAEAAAAIGQVEDARYYDDMAAKIRSAFMDWITANEGKMPIELMGAYLIPLYFDLVPESYQNHFEKRFVQLIEENDYCLDTGFLATPFFFDTLCKIGRRDLAYKVFYQEKAPSFMAELNQGATTIWESWFTYNEEGEPFHVSLNHYSFGCVDDWMFRTITGINKTMPGFKHIVIAPTPDESLTWAERSFDSTYGTITSKWRKENGQFILNVAIPCNTTATVKMPDGTEHKTGSGEYEFRCAI